MSKHQKTPLVTKLLGYTTIAIVGGTAIATFLPSSYYSGAPLTDSANILASVEGMISPTSKPVPSSATITPSIATTTTEAKPSSMTSLHVHSTSVSVPKKKLIVSSTSNTHASSSAP